MKISRSLPWLTLAVVAALPLQAAPLDLDVGLRASIWNDNYRLGVGGELGAIAGLGKVDLGLHLNYSHYSVKEETSGFDPANEFGGYLALYLLPPIDQAFRVRLGPHLGASFFKANGNSTYLDVGGDAAAVFDATPGMSFYGTFIPSYYINLSGGGKSDLMIRIGFGVEFHVSGAAIAPARTEPAANPVEPGSP